MRAIRPLTAIATAVLWCVVWIFVVITIFEHSSQINDWAVTRYGSIAGLTNQNSYFRWLMYFSPYLRIGEFIFGGFIAQLYIILQSRPPSATESAVGHALLWLGIASIPIMTYLMYAGSWDYVRMLNLNFGLAPSVAIILFCSARYQSAVSRFLNTGPIIALGEASYSMYLFHFLIFNISASFLGGPLPGTAPNIAFLFGKLLFLLGLIVLISLGMHAYFEVPSRRWLRSLWSAKTGHGRAIAYSIFAAPAIVATAIVVARHAIPPNPAVTNGIEIMAATYGGNCRAPRGNVSAALRRACNTKHICNYIIDVDVLGDPADGCAKDFVVEYMCEPNTTRMVQKIPGEAGLKGQLFLSCPPDPQK
jgi:hypothetical protein